MVKKIYCARILIEGARFPPFVFNTAEIRSESNEIMILEGSGVSLGSLWGHFWGHFGVIVGPVWDHFWHMKVTLRGISGSLWGHFEHIDVEFHV